MTAGGSLRVVAVADTDSYVKWSAALLGAADVDPFLAVLDTELVVSDGQLDAALAGSGLATTAVRRVTFDDLPAVLEGADVVLAASRGPLARVVARTAASLEPRPVIATGLPGISVPATWLALHFRRECDMFVLHSHREVREFSSLAAERGIDQRFALATLPFARVVAPAPRTGHDLVFAAQAIVPREQGDRERVARILVRAAEADPSRRVVLKLRGRPGEQETHREDVSYPALIEAIGRPENLVVSYEPMSEALGTAEGLVTVSSTAAIEAAARGVPVIALDAFGVSDELINTVFLGSGLLGSEDDVVGRRFHTARPEWITDNYFHAPEDDTWLDLAHSLVERRRAGLLPPRIRRRAVGGRARDVWERRLALGSRDRTFAGRAAYAVGVPARILVRLGRKTARIIREARSATAPGGSP